MKSMNAIKKRVYSVPEVEKIEIDRQISLAMASAGTEPESDPEPYSKANISETPNELC
jgi:hypothetical protein